MNTKQQPDIDHDLIDQLKSLKLQQVPPDLTEKIMGRVGTKRPGIVSWFSNLFLRPVTISLRPAYVCSVALLIGGAFFLGRMGIEQDIDVVVTPPKLNNLEIASAKTALLIGKELLRAEQEHQAIQLLQRAALLAPEDPEIAYWEGVAYWINGDQELERKSYLRGLESEPESVSLLMNLGHNYLNAGEYRRALDVYQAVLSRSPELTDALYNSSLIYRKLGESKNETDTLKKYLEQKRSGRPAFKAVERLNELGDFSYRPYTIGIRNVIVSSDIWRTDSISNDQLYSELAPIIDILTNNQQLRLDIVGFVEGNREAAKHRAWILKKRLITFSNGDLQGRVTISWFDQPESIKVSESLTYELSEGLLLFSSIVPMKKMEVPI